MQLYQFEKIYSQMGKEFGKMKDGEEEVYAMLLAAMEGNALKIYRSYSTSNSRRMREAIALVLFDIKEKYMDEKIDTGKFRNEDNERLEKALLMAFDPYTNAEVMDVLEQQGIIDGDSKDGLKEYYTIPVMCLLRIKDSIDTWEKRSGSNGYFDFIEGFMGSQIKGTEMNFSIISQGLAEM